MLKSILVLTAATVMISCGGSKDESKKAADSTATPAVDTTKKAVAPAATPFSKEVSFQKIKFNVTSPGSATGNAFTLTPSGYSADNTAYTENIDGQVKDVIVDDIDGDNNPEVAVIVMNASNKGHVYIYSSNKDKSLSMANIPEIADTDKSMVGYKGMDEYNFVEGSFIRRFPLFDGDTKTAKMRQFQYKLKPGEASKQLVIYKTVEF